MRNYPARRELSYLYDHWAKIKNEDEYKLWSCIHVARSVELEHTCLLV